MRTTLTLEADVEELLRNETHRTRKSFKTVVNEAIRKGLAGDRVEENAAPYRVHPKPMGLKAGIDPTKLQSLADDLDVETFLTQSAAAPGQAE